jgi:hypothetical protein
VDDKSQSRGAGGKFLPGHDVGEATRFPPGVCPNPAGVSKLQAEYDAFKDRLFDPEIRDAAFAVLKRAVIMGQQWATLKWFDLAVRVLPQTAIDVNVTADITASRKEADEQLEFITRELARYAAGRRAASDPVEAGSDASPAHVALLGPPKSD